METDFGVCDRQTDRQWHIVFCSHLFAMYSEHESGLGFTSQSQERRSASGAQGQTTLSRETLSDGGDGAKVHMFHSDFYKVPLSSHMGEPLYPPSCGLGCSDVRRVRCEVTWRWIKRSLFCTASWPWL